MIACLLRDIREEVIGLLFNRHVFRTHQEIVRANPRLQGRPQSIFAEWAWIVYGVANAMGVRRLASATYEDGDVNLVRLLDALIREPAKLWPCFVHYYPVDAAQAQAEILRKEKEPQPSWEGLACRRLLGEDRKSLINAAEKANQFASKRAAHNAPGAIVSTTFSDLDDAIDTVKGITEKYTILVACIAREFLEPAHRAGLPTVHDLLEKAEQNSDLLEEMKRRKLPGGWDSIFLEPWATPSTITRPLGETPPPRKDTGKPNE